MPALTYVDNEPLGRVRFVPLYQERYRLLISADAPLGKRARVSWAEVGSIPLCLLTPDMQNRRIIDRRLRDAGVEPAPTLQSELDGGAVHPCAHRALGQRDAGGAGRDDGPDDADPRRCRSTTTDPPMIGLVYPQREPMTPLTAALVTEARRLGQVAGRRTIDFFYRRYAARFLAFRPPTALLLMRRGRAG